MGVELCSGGNRAVFFPTRSGYVFDHPQEFFKWYNDASVKIGEGMCFLWRNPMGRRRKGKEKASQPVSQPKQCRQRWVLCVLKMASGGTLLMGIPRSSATSCNSCRSTVHSRWIASRLRTTICSGRWSRSGGKGKEMGLELCSGGNRALFFPTRSGDVFYFACVCTGLPEQVLGGEGGWELVCLRACPQGAQGKGKSMSMGSRVKSMCSMSSGVTLCRGVWDPAQHVGSHVV